MINIASKKEGDCSMGKNQHVTPYPDGRWQVKGSGNSRATARVSTQSEAISNSFITVAAILFKRIKNFC